MMKKTTLLTEPPAGKAIVTFARPSAFGGAIQFGLWDGETFVGIISSKSLVQCVVEPGEHIFLARAENWSYVKANVAAGKEYYVIGKVFPGVWKARVALDPITQAGLEAPGEKDKIASWKRTLAPTATMPSQVERYSKPRLAQVREAIEEINKGNVKSYGVLEPKDGL
jgi:hypothetical protein